MRAFATQWSSLEVRSPEFYPCGDVVIVRSHVHAQARATGQSVDYPLLQFIRIRQGRILELRPFYWDTAALLPALSIEAASTGRTPIAQRLPMDERASSPRAKG